MPDAWAFGVTAHRLPEVLQDLFRRPGTAEAAGQDGRDRGEHAGLCAVVPAVQEKRLGRIVTVQLRLDECHGVQRVAARALAENLRGFRRSRVA